MFLEPKPFSESNSCKPRAMAASRVFSCVPSWPRDFRPYCLKSKPPASLISNSAILRFTAPKSTARNDFEFNITLQPAIIDLQACFDSSLSRSLCWVLITLLKVKHKFYFDDHLVIDDRSVIIFPRHSGAVASMTESERRVGPPRRTPSEANPNIHSSIYPLLLGSTTNSAFRTLHSAFPIPHSQFRTSHWLAPQSHSAFKVAVPAFIKRWHHRCHGWLVRFFFLPKLAEFDSMGT